MIIRSFESIARIGFWRIALARFAAYSVVDPNEDSDQLAHVLVCALALFGARTGHVAINE